MDKAIFKRLCRGIGLPVVDWREVTRRALGGATATTSAASSTAFAAGTGDGRADGQAGPARQLGRDDARPRRSRDRRRARPAFRHDTLALAETYLPGARDLEVSVIGNDPARIELFGPGEIVSGHEFYDYAAKYTPGLSETSTRAEVTDRQRAMILKIARDAYRAIGAEGFARVDFLVHGEAIYLSEINTIPGFTPISLFPTLPAEGGYSFADVCARIVDLALERHASRAPAPPHARRTCPDERPARRPPVADAGPRPAGVTRVGPPRLGRAVAGPGRRGAGDAARRRRDLRRRRRRRPSRTPTSRSTGASLTDAGADRGRPRRRPRPEPVRAPDRPARGSARADYRRSPTPASTSGCPGTLAVTLARARAGPDLAGRRAALPRRCRRRPVRAAAPTIRRPRPAALPVIDDRRAASVGLSVGQRLDPVDLDAATRLASLRPADVGSAAPRAGGDRHRRQRVRRPGPAEWLVGGLRLLHAEAPDDRPHPRPGAPPAQPARWPRADGRARDLASDTDGTYVTRRRPPKPTPRPSTPHAEADTTATPNRPRPTARRARRPPRRHDRPDAVASRP